MNMRIKLNDKKNWLVYAILTTVNKLILRHRFRSIEITGLENLPQGPFLAVSNHTKRWDGLLMYFLLNRPSNFLVSPNELKGLQGLILKSMGAVPASVNFDLKDYARRQFSKGEPLVIFPEGNIFRDGTTHPFKSGAARFALACAKEGLQLPVVPIAIVYGFEARTVKIAVAPPVVPGETNVRSLTERLHREVCHLRFELGITADQHTLFGPKRTGSWVQTIAAG